MKIRPVGADRQTDMTKLTAELLRVDRQTDMTKLTVTFRNCANAPKNLQFRVILTGLVTGQM